MTFAYTSGNPDNLVGGNSAAMDDIQGPFYDIRAYLNGGALETLARGLLVIGEVRFIAVPTAPALWLSADGAAASRSTYSQLFTAIGTTYGAGDGVNTFNTPDLRGRVPVGVGQARAAHASDGTDGAPIAGAVNRLIGTRWGVDAVVLDATQLPGHTHPNNLSAAAVGDHVHAVSIGPDPVVDTNSWRIPFAGSVQNWESVGQATGLFIPISAASQWQATDGNHTHHGSIGGGGSHGHSMNGGVTANTGGGSGHENAMPAQAIPAYIYAGA